MGQKGFTLLEVLASAAILGLGIVAVIGLFSRSLGLAKASLDSTSGVLFAREKMNEVLLDEGVGEGNSKGISEGFDWILSVKEFDGKLPQGAPKVLKIELSVSGPRGAPVRLTSLKSVFKRNENR